MGNRAIYHDGWIASATPIAPSWDMGLGELPTDVMNSYSWELYNLSEDIAQANNIVSENPKKLRELQDLFIMEPTKYNVFPLDNSVVTRLVAPRPHLESERTFYTYSGVISQIPSRDSFELIKPIIYDYRGCRGVVQWCRRDPCYSRWRGDS